MYRSIIRLSHSYASASISHAKFIGRSHQKRVSAIAPQGVRYFTPSRLSNNASPVPSYDINHEFFNFTRGRFLCDETLELKRRRRTFNVHELMRIAAQAVGATHCERIEKLPDGMQNRILLLSMSNGKQVIAQIPNPNAGRPHFTTASEVATMTFVREVMGTPLPKVYAWSSRAQETAVGAEFIIMEKMEGITLKGASLPLDSPQMLQVVKSVADHVHTWSSFTFEEYGSLYFAEDLKSHRFPAVRYTDSSGNQISDKRFVVGPLSGYFLAERAQDALSLDRGPWSSIEMFHDAIVQRGLACLEHTAPLSPTTGICGPGLYQPTRKMKIRALMAYPRIYPFMIPLDHSMSAPHLSHGDLDHRHILVDPNDPAKIVGIIRWQNTAILPLHYHKLEPGWLYDRQPELDPQDNPPLPSDFRLGLIKQKKAQSLQLKKHLSCVYMSYMSSQSPKIQECLKLCEDMVFQAWMFPFCMFEANDTLFLFGITMLEQEWDTLPRAEGLVFPFEWADEEEKQAIVNATLKVCEGVKLMMTLQDKLVESNMMDEDEVEILLTTDYQYYAAVDILATFEALMIGSFAQNPQEAEEWKAQWPFRRE